MVSESLINFEKYQLRMRKKFRHFFIFLPEKNKYEKNFDVIFWQNVAYKTLIQFTKPWTLYLVLVLR